MIARYAPPRVVAYTRRTEPWLVRLRRGAFAFEGRGSPTLPETRTFDTLILVDYQDNPKYTATELFDTLATVAYLSNESAAHVASLDQLISVFYDAASTEQHFDRLDQLITVLYETSPSVTGTVTLVVPFAMLVLFDDNEAALFSELADQQITVTYDTAVSDTHVGRADYGMVVDYLTATLEQHASTEQYQIVVTWQPGVTKQTPWRWVERKPIVLPERLIIEHEPAIVVSAREKEVVD